MLSHPYLECCPGRTGKAWWPGKAAFQSFAALVLGVIFALTLAPGNTCAQENQKPTKRTIYVPFDDLPVILGGPNQRVFLTREEFEELQKLASKKPSEAAPVAAILLESRYEIDVKDQLATIQGTLEIDVLNPGLHTVALPMSGVQLRSAQLDDQPAPVGRDEAGKVVLFVQGEGRHRLDLELQTPVTISAAQQSLELQLPQSGSSQLLVNVPGNVEVKSGATVIDRQFDEPTEMTQFELMASRGPTALVMSLNNRRLRDDRVVVARGVYVSEITTTYERLHATISLDVLHGACGAVLAGRAHRFSSDGCFVTTHVAVGNSARRRS